MIGFGVSFDDLVLCLLFGLVIFAVLLDFWVGYCLFAVCCCLCFDVGCFVSDVGILFVDWLFWVVMMFWMVKRLIEFVVYS